MFALQLAYSIHSPNVHACKFGESDSGPPVKSGHIIFSDGSSADHANVVSDNLPWQQKELFESINYTEEDLNKDEDIIYELKENIEKEKLKTNKFKYDNDKLRKENRLLKQIIDRNTEHIRKSK